MLLRLPLMEGHGTGIREKNGPALAGHGAEAVRDAIAREITTLPEQLRRSLTWDQGAEMAQHARLRVDTGLAVYFCDPHSHRAAIRPEGRHRRRAMPRGSVARTRTPTGCCGSTFPRAPTAVRPSYGRT